MRIVSFNKSVNLLPCVIDDLSRRCLLGKKTSKVFNIPLQAALIDAEVVSRSFFLHADSLDKILI